MQCIGIWLYIRYHHFVLHPAISWLSNNFVLDLGAMRQQRMINIKQNEHQNKLKLISKRKKKSYPRCASGKKVSNRN